ncbi:hypothetical protein [Streptomyces sp. NPDC059928]|uniref:hypothetical protein n=1 Tax=unclassified Streptomyces TaxID=2593676 RepID=UPI00365E793A
MLIKYLREMFPHVESEDPVSYVSEAGDAINALLYSLLYWPRLVEVHGAVFVALSGNDEVEIRERLSAPAGSAIPNWLSLSWPEVVDSYNIFEIGHLFQSVAAAAEDSDSLHHVLGGILVKSWSARLAEGYPERRFSVRLVEPDESMMELRIEVAQVSPALATPGGWNGQLRKVVQA